MNKFHLSLLVVFLLSTAGCATHQESSKLQASWLLDRQMYVANAEIDRLNREIEQARHRQLESQLERRRPSQP